jgi:ATP-dependent Clp protease, protease subunit
MMKNRNKFWRWARNALEGPMQEGSEERTLFLDGTIASESWFDDDVTPALFKSDLNAGSGDITVWINSPGGDVFAAAQIYNMLRDYKGKVTVKIDGIAASAASVIAMAGDSVLMSPVSMLMIHNPSTVAMGDKTEMEKAIEMLNSVKDSIINAYQAKTGLSRNKLSKLMDEETWMDSGKAVELHFADGIIDRSELYGVSPSDKPKEDDPGEAKPDEPDEDTPDEGDDPDEEKKKDDSLDLFSGHESMLFSRYQVAAATGKKLLSYCKEHETTDAKPQPHADLHTETHHTYQIDDLERRLDLMKHFL